MEGALSRLLFVAGSAHPLGGLATWLDTLLPGLAERGWEPTLGLLEGPRHHRPARYLRVHPHDPWMPIPCRTGTPEGRARALLDALRSRRPAIAIGVNAPDLFPALARARRAGLHVRGLLTVHGLEPDLYVDAARFRGAVDAAAGTNRLSCALLVRESGIPPERVFYAPYGVRFGEGRERAEPGSPLRVGFAGRIEQSQKRVLDLAAVDRALGWIGVPVTWRIAGAGPAAETLRGSLPRDRCEMIGAIRADELPERLYRRIDALLVLSSWETGPLVAWEAMAEGVPVVSSRYVGSGLEGALRHEENALLFPVGDAEEAARQLARLARDAPLRERLAAGGRSLVGRRYTREASLEAWHRGLASLLERAPLDPGPPPVVRRATGRLDRWLGPRRGETVRAALGRTGPDAGSGGEWPHAYGPGSPREEFLRKAADLDRGELAEPAR